MKTEKPKYKFVRYASNGMDPVAPGDQGNWFLSRLEPGIIFFAGSKLWIVLKVLA